MYPCKYNDVSMPFNKNWCKDVKRHLRILAGHFTTKINNIFACRKSVFFIKMSTANDPVE